MKKKDDFKVGDFVVLKTGGVSQDVFSFDDLAWVCERKGVGTIVDISETYGNRSKFPVSAIKVYWHEKGHIRRVREEEIVRVE